MSQVMRPVEQKESTIWKGILIYEGGPDHIEQWDKEIGEKLEH
jgi:hypothetical protein